MRRPIVAGNWKMHLALGEAEALARSLARSCPVERVDVVLCPPFTALAVVGRALEGSRIALGAQGMFWERQGAFTGEVSGAMLTDAGCRYVILGHSERRAMFGETDERVSRRARAALEQGLVPIICIGETLAQRDAQETFDVLTRQLDGSLAGVPDEALARVVLAYEPVWAIGTGRNATPEQAQEAHRFIRGRMAARMGAVGAAALRIQYGGSVNAGNAASLLLQPDVDGALVGGASLKADTFEAIVRAAIRPGSKAAAATEAS